MRLSEPRIKPLTDAELEADVLAMLEPMRAGPGGRVLNIFRTLVHHPKLVKRWLVFGNHVLAKSTLPAREREIAILRVGYRCRAIYEWTQHVAIGKETGLRDDEIRAIAEGPDAEGWNALDATILRATDELLDDAMVSDATWQALSEHWNTQQLIDLVFAVGQYNLVSMALNTLGVQTEEANEGFPV